MDLSACDDSDLSCPLCLEEMDSTDRKFQPCHCGYQICLWCWHHIMEMANKDNLEGRCPACRSPYDKEKIVSASPAAQDEFSEAGGGDKKQKGKGKGRTNFGSGGGGGDIRKHLSNVRVVQRNLVYVVGMPMSLADEETLERREYFGQYGRVLKIAVSRSTSGISGSSTLHGATANVYVTFVKEEDAVRCIQAVDGCIFEGRTLRACFGTTKYCNAWLKNLSCNNPDCLYLHEIGTQEDSYTKEEMLHNKHHQYDAASMVSRRAANGLPPPLDGYSEKVPYSGFSSGGSSRGVTSTTTAVAGSKVGGSGGGTSGGLLPAAASWGSKGSTSGKLVLSAPRPFGTSGPAQVAPSPYANANGQVHSGAHGLNGPSTLHAAAWPPPSSSTMPASSSSLNPSTLSPAIAIPGSVTQMYPYKPSAAVLSSRVIQASAHSPPVFSSGVGSGSGLSNSLGAGGQAVGIRGRSPYRERGRQKSPTASPFGSPPPPSFAMAASTQASTSLSSTPIRSGGVTVLLRAPDPSLVAATSGLSSRLGGSTATSSGATSAGAQQVLEEATSTGLSNRKGDGILKQTDPESKAGPGSAKNGGGGKSGAGKAASASSSSSSSSSSSFTAGSSASIVATKSSSSTSGISSSSTINSSASSSKSGSSSGVTNIASSSGGSGGSSLGSKKGTKSSSLDDVAMSAAGGSKKAAKLSSSDDATTNSSTSGRSSSNSTTSMKGGASVSTATGTSTTAGSSSSSSSSGSSSSSTSSSKSISNSSSMMSSSNGGKVSSSSSSLSAGAANSAAGSSGPVSSRSTKSSSSVSATAKNATASSSSSSSSGDEEVMSSKGSDGTGVTRSSSNPAIATSTSSGPTSSATLSKSARGDAAEEGSQPQEAAASLGTAKGKPRVAAAAKAEPHAVKESESEAAAAASTERGRKKGRVEVEEASTSSSEGKADSCTEEASVADAGVAEETQATERAATAEKSSAVEAVAANFARGGGAADAAEAHAREAANVKPSGGSEDEASAVRAWDNAPTPDGPALSSTLLVADGVKVPPQAASMAAGKVISTTATLSAPPGFGMRPPRVQLQQPQLALSAQTGSAGEAAGGPALTDRPVASVGVSQESRKHEQQHQFHMLAQQTQRQHGVGEPWLVHDSAIVSFSELNVGASAVPSLATQRLGVASRSDTSLSALEARGLQLSSVSEALPPHPLEGSGRGGAVEGQAVQRHNYVAREPSGLPTSISVPSLLASLGANSLSSLPSLGPAASSSYMALPTISTQGFGVVPVPPVAAATVATPSLPLHARQVPLMGSEASARAGVGLSNLSRALLGLGPRSQLGSVMPEVDESQVIADILQMDAVDELWRLPSLATSSAAAHPTLPAELAAPLAADTARPEPAAAAGGREDSVHGGAGSSAEALAAAGSSLARVLRSVSLSRSATDSARGGVSAGAGGDSQGRNGLLGGGAYAAANGPPKRSRFRFAQTEEEQGGGVQQAHDETRAHSQQLHELLQQQQVEQQLKQFLQQSQQKLKQQQLIEPQQQKGLWAFDVESRSAGLTSAEGVQAAAQSMSESAVSQGVAGASQGQLSVPPGFGARRVFSSSPTPPAVAVVAAGSVGPAAGAGAGAGAGGVGVVRASSMGSVPQQPLPQPQTGGVGAGLPPVQVPPGFGPARSASAKVWQPQMQQGTSASAGAAAPTAAVPFAPPGFALSSSGVGGVAGLQSAGVPAAASTLLSLSSSLSHTLGGSSTGSSSGAAATTAAVGWPQDTAIAWTSEQIAYAGLGGQPQLLGASRMYGSRNNLSSIVEGGNSAGTAQSALALAAQTSTSADVSTATTTAAALARSDSQAVAGMYSQPVYRAAASVAAPPPGFSSSADPVLSLSSSRYAREATLSEWLGIGLGGSSSAGGSSNIGKNVMEPLVAAAPTRSTEGGLPASIGERYGTEQEPKQQQWLQPSVPKVGSTKVEDQWQVLDQRQQKQQSHMQLPLVAEQEMQQQPQLTRSQQDHLPLQKQQQKQAPQQQGQQGPPGYAWTRSTQPTEPQLEPWQLLPETDAVPLALAGQPGSFVGRLGSAASGAVLLQPRKAASRRGRFGFGLEPEESEMASGKEGAW